jgi:hypothetical protein
MAPMALEQLRSYGVTDQTELDLGRIKLLSIGPAGCAIWAMSVIANSTVGAQLPTNRISPKWASFLGRYQKDLWSHRLMT